MRFDPIRTSILRSNVHTMLGILLLFSCTLWASLAIIHTAWGINPLANAFSAMIVRETTLPN